MIGSQNCEVAVENSLKQRIVGAIVLIALAVIFLPSILKDKKQSQPFVSQIPDKPTALVEYEISEETQQKNKKVQQSLDEFEASKQQKQVLSTQPPQKTVEPEKKSLTKVSPIAEKTDPANNKANKQPINKAFVDAAWVIQIASFSNKDNAIKFVAKLKAKKHKAYHRLVTNNQAKKVYRIFVGPYMKKSQAQKALVEVNKLSHSKGMLLAYDPVIH